MYHGVDRRKLTDRRKGERRKFDPVAAQAHEEGLRSGKLKERRRLEDRRQQGRREADHRAHPGLSGLPPNEDSA
jgi:hypothetical protein